MDVEEISARLEIQQVILNLARGTDRRDAARMSDCYHPDARDDHNMFRGPASEFVELVLSASNEWMSCTHAPSPALIEVDGTRAWAETIVVAHHVAKENSPSGHMDLVIGARWEDAFEKRDGRWRIALRTVIYDWVGELTLAPGNRPSRRMPLPDDFRVGRPDDLDPSYDVRGQALDSPSA